MTASNGSVPILAVGSVALDTITTPEGSREEIMGGSASHFAVCASYFEKVGLVGVVGQDFPEEHREALRSRDVDLTGLQVRDGRTFRWSGYYEIDYHVAHTRETQLNVFEDFDPAIPEAHLKVPYLFLGNIAPALQLDVLQRVERPRLIVGDTMNFWIESQRDQVLALIEAVDVMLLNDQEVRDLGGSRDLIRAGRKLLERTEVVVIKKGEHGAIMLADDDIFCAPAYPYVDVVDPTGAGDSFAGGFLGSLARAGEVTSATLRRAVIHGCIMGSCNVEGFGLDRTLHLDSGEIARRFEEYRDLTRF